MRAALPCLCGHDVTLHALTVNSGHSGLCVVPGCECAPSPDPAPSFAERLPQFRRALRLIGGLVCLALAAGLTIVWALVLYVIPSAAWNTFMALVAALLVLMSAALRLLLRRRHPARHRPASQVVPPVPDSRQLKRLLKDVVRHDREFAPQRRRRNVAPLAGRSWRPIRQRNKQRSGR